MHLAWDTSGISNHWVLRTCEHKSPKSLASWIRTWTYHSNRKMACMSETGGAEPSFFGAPFATQTLIVSTRWMGDSGDGDSGDPVRNG